MKVKKSMTFREWMKKKNITLHQIARDIDVRDETVCNWMNKKSFSKSAILAVYNYTNGEVTPNDWFDI